MLWKLRKIAQGEAGPTTPVKASRKKAATTPTGVKKSRKHATRGKGKKAKAINGADDEDVPTKMEPVSDDGDHTPTSKKRKYKDAADGSGNDGEEESVVKSESVDPAQNDFDELLTA